MLTLAVFLYAPLALLLVVFVCKSAARNVERKERLARLEQERRARTVPLPPEMADAYHERRPVYP
ncbi:MAG: hypothetical protein L0Y66_25655 [Myxococcaceae bacterium]|nr:hypothetical protein [Myxococcaceae bacterium]